MGKALVTVRQKPLQSSTTMHRFQQLVSRYTVTARHQAAFVASLCLAIRSYQFATPTSKHSETKPTTKRAGFSLQPLQPTTPRWGRGEKQPQRSMAWRHPSLETKGRFGRGEWWQREWQRGGADGCQRPPLPGVHFRRFIPIAVSCSIHPPVELLPANARPRRQRQVHR